MRKEEGLEPEPGNAVWPLHRALIGQDGLRLEQGFPWFRSPRGGVGNGWSSIARGEFSGSRVSAKAHGISGCWRALAKGTAWAGFYSTILHHTSSWATSQSPIIKATFFLWKVPKEGLRLYKKRNREHKRLQQETSTGVRHYNPIDSAEPQHEPVTKSSARLSPIRHRTPLVHTTPQCAPETRPASLQLTGASAIPLSH